ncbi:MAG: glycoside hydrolase domain-containing protein [Acidimicrobiales bacterium]
MLLSDGRPTLFFNLFNPSPLAASTRSFLRAMPRPFSSKSWTLCARGVFFVALFLATLSDVALPAHAATWRVFPVSSLHKITATAPGVLEKFPVTKARLRAARGEWESFQVVVRAGENELRDVTFQVAPLRSSRGAIAPVETRVFAEHFVFIGSPSGNARLEKLWWPDALFPLPNAAASTIAPHRAAVFWVNLRIAPNATAGDYASTLIVSANEKSSATRRALPVQLRIENVLLPAPTARATVAVYYETLRDWYAKNLSPLSDEQFAQTKKRCYDFLLDYRLNTYDLPVAWGTPQAANYLRDARVLAVRLPALNAPDFNIAVAQLRAENALPKAYYYRHDEPSPEQFASVRETGKTLHALGLRQLVTAPPIPELENAVDIWCPNLGDFFGVGSLDLAALQRERARGKETWIYTMVEPKHPYPTWLVDDDAFAIRLFGWQMARFGFGGFVYSMAHGWGPKPLENIASFAGTNGDGTLLYPGELTGQSEPLPSLRLMLLRDALEDYGLLQPLSPTARDAVASRAVGATPATRIDRAGDWRRDVYRNVLFDALNEKSIAPRAASTRALPKVSIVRVRDAAPLIDGEIEASEWPQRARQKAKFARFFGDKVSLPETQLWTQWDERALYVALRARRSRVLARDDKTPGEWFAVEIAAPDSDVRYRFIATEKGRGFVERKTRAGREEPKLAWNFSIQRHGDFYDVEMRLPRETLQRIAQENQSGTASISARKKTNRINAIIAIRNAENWTRGTMPFRFNALRRMTVPPPGATSPPLRVLARAFPDDGDIARTPFAKLR